VAGPDAREITVALEEAEQRAAQHVDVGVTQIAAQLGLHPAALGERGTAHGPPAC
jgi:hypothetical protein